MNGQVVHAVRGARTQYKAITSSIVSSADPLHVVERFLELYTPQSIYIADLDAITGNGSNQDVIDVALEQFDCEYLVDGGYRKLADIPCHPRLTPVIATETFEEWRAVKTLSRMVVSIDTKSGALISRLPEMTVAKVLSLARRAGAKRFIHLRIDAVGSKTFSSSAFLKPEHGERWLAGGGVRRVEDLLKLTDMGYAGALVSTALHEKTIT